MNPRLDTSPGSAPPQVVLLSEWRRSHGHAPTIRAARAEEAAMLTSLCLRTKASLGIGEDMLRLWAPALTIPAEAIDAGRVLVAVEAAALGVAAGGPVIDGMAELALLCVDPSAVGHGVGRALFGAITAQLHGQGARRMTILADRSAASFYRRLGAVPTGVAPGVDGRMLPSFVLELA